VTLLRGRYTVRAELSGFKTHAWSGAGSGSGAGSERAQAGGRSPDGDR
jgi:hypothetical protein